MLISGTFGIFQFHHTSAYLSIGNLIASSAGLFLASIRSCLKTTGVMKMYGMLIFVFFFATLWKIFELFHFFSKTTEPIFKSMVSLEKLAAILCACIFC